MESYEELLRAARAEVARVADDPDGRLRLREAYYRKYGFGRVEPYGDGTSELAFLRWMIERGVLSPLDAKRPGSRWWRAVDDTFLLASQLGGLAHEAGLALDDVPDDRVRFWVEYIRKPTATRWYRAHNASIVHGYLAHRELARLESEAERVFLNEVLYRVLFAQGLVEGAELGALGELLADPAGPAVALLVHVEAFYPRHYPLTDADVANVRHLGCGLPEDLARILDQKMILPHVGDLYALVAGEIDEPELPRLIKDGVPIYPDRVAAPSRAGGKRSRVVVLGGGIAGLTAAWELTRHEGWQDEYDVTVVQLGFRVGGKTATGRGAHDRVEEHGIHILQGWYDNTFQLVRDVYAERRRRGLAPHAPFQEWHQAFQRNDATIITEWSPVAGRWIHWPLVFPRNDAIPGDGPPLSTWQVIRKVAGLVLELVLGSPYQRGETPVAKWILDHFFSVVGGGGPLRSWLGDVASWVERTAEHALAPLVSKRVDALLDRVEDPSHAEHGEALLDLLRLLETGAAWIERQLGGASELDFRILRDLVLVELALVNLRGIVADVWDPSTKRFEFARIDGHDYRAWIASHGASERVLRSGAVRFFYVGTFANLAGGRGDGGTLAAGTALRFVLRSAGYKGSFVWQMRAGTGDTVIMPLYEVLRARGVRFSFFSRVEDLEIDAAGVSAIRVADQVTLRVPEYEPTELVGDLRAWPGEPRWTQLDPAQAEELRSRGIDLECPWADWTPPSRRTLARGADFDRVVLAIPIAALPSACPSILASDERWRRMVAEVKTTATMSMQLWLGPSLREMGFVPSEWGLASRDQAPNVVTYADPMYSWLDSSLVGWTERWPAPAPKLIAYFTGAMADPPRVPPFDDHGFPARMRESLKSGMRQWLADHMAYFWPRGATREWPQGLDTRLLASSDPEASGEERFEQQYFRANVDPSARYTLSLPGSAEHRLRTDESGYPNLFLAGDWIDFGMNVGYIEGALTSGAQAARAVRTSLDLPLVPSAFSDLDPASS